MSGGQQMLAIGRALVGNLDPLLVSERGGSPVLDSQRYFRNLRVINEELDTTVLFVEQNLGVRRDTADACHSMKRG